MQPPVIVLPGITATTLRDEYPLDPETVWAILGKEYDRVGLHPDDLRFETREPARVRPDVVFTIPYREFIQELRHDLAEKGDEPVPVYGFPYDWRQPLEKTQARLGELIDEVVARTSIMRHYHKADYGENPVVDLVGHSMGGLVIAGYLASTGDSRVRRVATLGSPFRGSFEAVIKVATGTAELGERGGSGSREREIARLTPALYHLIPSFEDAFEADGDVSTDLFDAGAWQPGVVATIGEYIRLHGVDPPRSRRGREERGLGILQAILDEARTHRELIEGLSPDAAGLTEEDWLCIVGVGEETRVSMTITDRRGDPWFDLGSSARKNGYPVPPRDEEGRFRMKIWETGDGTVPYLGARCSFVPLAKVIAVSDDDFGYWELGDRLVKRLAGLHGMLPEMNLVRKLVVAHLKAEAGQPGRAHPGVWGRRAPDLAFNADWEPPIRGLREKGLDFVRE
ncbi:MAG: hypothetical protein PVI57_18185 [Gemmatimonadota bacterium]|jgi:hypothetical protein